MDLGVRKIMKNSSLGIVCSMEVIVGLSGERKGLSGSIGHGER